MTVTTDASRLFASVSIPVGDAHEIERLAGRAQRIEALGFDATFVTDHPAPPRAWLEGSGHATLDPFVALGFIAAATSTLRLHTNLLVLPYRHPIATAKAVASLDAVSAGRTLLGVGVGYLAGEFGALGVDLAQRGTTADQALATMRAAWLGEPFGEHDTIIEPVPVQRPHPPIWVGGNSVAAMRRAITHGQGWAPMPSPKAASAALGTPGIESVDELAARIGRLHQLAAEAGRTEPLDVAAIPTTVSGFASSQPSTDQVLDELGALRAAGATAFVFSLPDAGYDDRLDWLAGDVLDQM